MKIRNVMGAKLTLDSGETVLLEKLGKGMFHTCYLDPKTQQVYSITIERDMASDYSKEILSNCDANPHIPPVEALGYLDNSDRRVYCMPHYQPIRAAHKTAWNLLKSLEQARADAWNAIYSREVATHKMRGTDIGYLVNQLTCGVMDRPGVPQSLKDALDILRGESANYGSSYIFEFSRRNVMVDSTGNLILLDVLFDMEALEAIRSKRRQLIIAG